jgi:hypothetical protein
LRKKGDPMRLGQVLVVAALLTASSAYVRHSTSTAVTAAKGVPR